MYKKILVAVDGSRTSYSALKEALKLAQGQSSATVRLLHVVDVNILAMGEFAFEIGEFSDEMKKNGEKIVNGMAEIVKGMHIACETSVLELLAGKGTVAEKIVAEAKDCHADLLVLGTHGWRGFKRLLIGSVAENVIRQASIPVLLIRENEQSAF